MKMDNRTSGLAEGFGVGLADSDQNTEQDAAFETALLRSQAAGSRTLASNPSAPSLAAPSVSAPGLATSALGTLVTDALVAASSLVGDFTGSAAARSLVSTPATQTVAGNGFADGFDAHVSGAAGSGLTGASGPGLTTRLTEYQSGGTWHFSGNQDVDAVLIGSKWTITNLTYSFPTSAANYNTPYYKPDYVAHQEVLNAAQQTAAVYAFSLISSYTGLTFSQVTESDTVHGNIRISQTSSTQIPSAQGNFPGSDASDGDIWVGKSASNPQPFYLTPQIGNWGQAMFMHEIGHTMGLKHGNDDYTTVDMTVGGYVDGPAPFYGTAALAGSHDGQAWSLMTYRSDPSNKITFEGDEFNQPQTYMQDDIAALQYLYGANFTTNASDSVYTFSATTGEMFINGVSQGAPDGNKVFRTVWDGNGNDTYDFSNFSGDESVDLRAGGWSTFNAAQLANNRAYTGGVNYAPGNIANALMYNGDTRSLVENAIGGSGNDHMVGNQLGNTLTGNAGDDWLDGGLGNDTLIGGTGNDTYFVDNPGDVIVENAGEGNDTVAASFSYSLVGTQLENVTLTGTADINATGTDADNVLTGNSGSNILTGGLGNDTYVIQNIGDIIVEAAGAGTDTVVSSVTYTLGANLENLTLTGHDNLNGTGNAGDNVINGNIGDNYLSGGAGNDTLVGDILVVEPTVVVVDSGATLHDTIANAMVIGRSSFFIDANAEIANATTAPHATIHATGNNDYRMYAVTVDAAGIVGTFDIDHTLSSLDTVVRLYDANGVLLALNDDETTLDTGSVVKTDSLLQYTFAAAGTYYVEVSKYDHAVVPAGSGYDLNISLAGNTIVTYGDDTLDGGTGADTMSGSKGNDTYIVDNAGDIVIENAGEGTDTVQSSVSYILGNNVENLVLTGTLDRNGYGNSLDNVITGNSGANTLKGYDGNDTLDGGLGADTLIGGAGDDTYVVENPGDIVTESTNQGTDAVISNMYTYTLGQNVENLVLGDNSFNGVGNSLSNVIHGNVYDNLLDGGTGADTLYGGVGNDAYVVDNVGDVVVENANEGTDIITSSVTLTLGANVENLSLAGTAAINGTGNALNNMIVGSSRGRECSRFRSEIRGLRCRSPSGAARPTAPISSSMSSENHGNRN